MTDSGDRFGSEEAFRAAMESHGRDNPVFRMGMYVPTREEVATSNPDDLFEVLDLWMWEGPTEMIPTHAQIEQVRAILVERQDRETRAVRKLVELCDDYLEPENSASPVERDPDIHSGDLVFRGTRVPVSTLTAILRAGGTIDEFLEGWPTVTRRQVNAVLDGAAEAVARLYDDDRFRDLHSERDVP